MPLTFHFNAANLNPFIFLLEIVTLVIAITRSLAALNPLSFYQTQGKVKGEDINHVLVYLG